MFAASSTNRILICTCYALKYRGCIKDAKIRDLPLYTERRRRLKLPWDFNYLFIFIDSLCWFPSLSLLPSTCASSLFLLCVIFGEVGGGGGGGENSNMILVGNLAFTYLFFNLDIFFKIALLFIRYSIKFEKKLFNAIRMKYIMPI